MTDRKTRRSAQIMTKDGLTVFYQDRKARPDQRTQSGAEQSRASELPGMAFKCTITTPYGPLPLYHSAERTDGKPGINTREGWADLCRTVARKRLVKRYGREPSAEEINAEMGQSARSV